jgi:hypothetical protein
MSGAPITPVIYDQRCLGHIISRGPKGFEAFDADDKSIGTYPTQREAAAVIVGGDHP